MITEAFSFYDEPLDKSVHNGQTATRTTPSGTKPFTPGSHLALRNKPHKSKEDKKQLRGQVFHEWKHGGLKRGPGGKGGTVTDHQQAIAIALHESGESNQKSLDTDILSFYTEDLEKFWSDAAREAALVARHDAPRAAAEHTLAGAGWKTNNTAGIGSAQWTHPGLANHTITTSDFGWAHSGKGMADSQGGFANGHQSLKDKLASVSHMIAY